MVLRMIFRCKVDRSPRWLRRWAPPVHVEHETRDERDVEREDRDDERDEERDRELRRDWRDTLVFHQPVG